MARDLNRSIKIYIDHSDAMKKSKDLETRMEGLRNKLAELHTQGKKDSPEYARTEKALQGLVNTYGRYQDKLKETERILKNLSGSTEQELLMVRNKLRQDLKKTIRNTEEYKAVLQNLLAVERELAIVEKEKNSSMGRSGTMWSRMADGFNKYFGIVTSIVAGITGLSLTFRKLSEEVAKMDDVYSDVMKTTGMTRNEVLDLNETFKQMDTRTAREELNNLARDAGKLGLNGKKDILDFVEAGNQINVALGDDLGEGAIKNIGKMTDVYMLSTKELEKMDLKGKMLAIGSAINELGMSSTASEKYMVNFTQRLGGVASQAGISIQNILGYASALDQSGQAVEMSATALQKFIMKLMGEPAKFAKLAGLEIKTFNKLLHTDTNEAIKQVLSSLSNKGGFQALIPIFKDMGLDGARAVGVLSALATNIDKVNVAQKIANKSFSEGTSITNEYSIKNNNLNAQLEKARKNFKDASLELGESLNPVLLKSTKWTTYLIKSLPTVLDFFEKYGKYLLYLTVVYGLYVAGVKVAAAGEAIYNGILAIARLRRIQVALATTQSAAAQTLYNNVLQNGSIVTTAYTAVTSLLSAAKFILTGNITKAREALIAFSVAAKMNPAGLMASAVLALAAAFGYLLYKSSQVVTAQKAIESATKDLNAELAREQSEANKLFEALKRVNPESDEHRKITEKIIQLYGPYLKDLVDEKGNLLDVARAQETVNTKIRESIALKIKNAATDIIQTDGIKKQIDKVDEVVSMLQKQLGSSFSTEAANVVRENIHKAIEKSIAEGKTGMEELTAAIQSVVSKESNNMNQKFGFFDPKSIRFQTQIIASSIYQTQNNLKKVEDQFKGIISEATQLSSIIGDGNQGNNDYTPSGANPDKNVAAKQKKALDLLIESLETKHQEKLLEIKQKYQSGEIETESEYKVQLFTQEQAYYALRIQLLTEFLKTVTDKQLKSDISKEIAQLRVKQLDDALKHREAIEKIILDADPERKEKIAYENRLRDAGLFGVERENLTKDQFQALELLEQQHQDNLLKIRKDTKAKQKAASEEKFEEEFAERKAQLEQEIYDLKNSVALNVGMGALTGEDAFNAEVALQRKRIALIEEEGAAREKAVLDVSKVLKQQHRAEIGLTNLYVREYKRRTDEFAQYGKAMASSLGNAIANQENLLSAFGDSAIDILFEVLSKIISAEIAKVTAVGVSSIAQATAKEVGSKGFIGIGTAAVLTGLITAAMATAKSALKGLLSNNKGTSSKSNSSSVTTGKRVAQYAEGKYDVIGEKDGKLYKDVTYAGVAKTGVVTRPTLMGEQGSELVVSHPDFIALQKHINYPLIVNAIQDVRSGRVPQRADGKYDQIDIKQEETIGNSHINSRLLKAIDQLIGLLNYLRANPIRADLNIQTFEKKKAIYDDIKKTASKS